MSQRKRNYMNCRVRIRRLNSHQIQRANLDACYFKFRIITYFKELPQLVCCDQTDQRCSLPGTALGLALEVPPAGLLSEWPAWSSVPETVSVWKVLQVPLSKDPLIPWKPGMDGHPSCDTEKIKTCYTSSFLLSWKSALSWLTYTHA